MRRTVLLLGSGLVSEAVYLAAAVRLPWWRYGGRLDNWPRLLGAGWGTFGLCLAGIGALAAAYLLGWLAVRRGGAERRIVWAFAGLFAVTLFWLMPITSDLFTYLSQAHLLTDVKANPLLVAPLDVSGDRFVQAYPAHYAANPSVYGPAWLLLSSGGTLGRQDVVGGLLYLKGLSLAAYLGCAWFLERLLRRSGRDSALEALYLFAWNPLLLMMAVGDGHNDIVMMAGVLLAFWLLLRERWVPAFAVLALSVWIKYVSALFIPLFAIYTWRRLSGRPGRRPWPVLLGGAAAVVVVSALVFAPFWSPLLITRLVSRFLQPSNWQGGGGLAAWAMMVGLVLFAAVYALLAWRLAQGRALPQSLLNTSFVVSLAAFVLGMARSQPWHLIWPLALAGLSDRKWPWPTLVVLSVVMLAAQFWVEWGTPGLGF